MSAVPVAVSHQRRLPRRPPLGPPRLPESLGQVVAGELGRANARIREMIALRTTSHEQASAWREELSQHQRLLDNPRPGDSAHYLRIAIATAAVAILEKWIALESANGANLQDNVVHAERERGALWHARYLPVADWLRSRSQERPQTFGRDMTEEEMLAELTRLVGPLEWPEDEHSAR